MLNFILLLLLIVVVNTLHTLGLNMATWGNLSIDSEMLLHRTFKWIKSKNKYFYKFLGGCHRCAVSSQIFFTVFVFGVSYYLYTEFYQSGNFIVSYSFLYPFLIHCVTISSLFSEWLFNGFTSLSNSYEGVVGKSCDNSAPKTIKVDIQQDPLADVQKYIKNKNLSEEDRKKLLQYLLKPE